MKKSKYIITYKQIDVQNGKESWLKENIHKYSLLSEGFVEVTNVEGDIFILPRHVIARIDIVK